MTTSVCERCGGPDAKAHSFQYGKSTGMTDYRSGPTSSGGTQTSWTSHYQVGGTDTALVCDRCLQRARVRGSLKSLAKDYFGFPLIAFFYGLVVLSIGSLVIGGDAGRAAKWLLLALAPAAAVYVGIFVFNVPARVGERVAIDLHRDRLRERGWDMVWTEKEYRKLRPDSSPRFS